MLSPAREDQTTMTCGAIKLVTEDGERRAAVLREEPFIVQVQYFANRPFRVCDQFDEAECLRHLLIRSACQVFSFPLCLCVKSVCAELNSRKGPKVIQKVQKPDRICGSKQTLCYHFQNAQD